MLYLGLEVARLTAPEHELGLRHGPLGRVHEQQAGVRHVQDALHLSAEVRVARRIHNVHLQTAKIVASKDALMPL